MTFRVLMLFVLIAAACGSDAPPAPAHNARVAAAQLFTQRFAHSRFADWKIRANAAGNDCDVLLVQTPVVMEDAMVEALHYGAGAYGVVEGGVQRFARDRSFRGVAYKDSSGRFWTYGDVTAARAETLKPCD
jgi:hypothetical protein